VKYWYSRKPSKPQNEVKIVISFSIDEMGVPHKAKLLRTNLSDSLFVKKVVADISEWRFARYMNGSDTTSVTYPITLR